MAIWYSTFQARPGRHWFAISKPELSCCAMVVTCKLHANTNRAHIKRDEDLGNAISPPLII
jgi:hypothetical protein